MPTSTPCMSAGQGDAEHDGAGHVRELAKQPILAFLVQRNQPAGTGGHEIAVAQKKEQEAQHDREADDRSVRAK